MHAIHTGEYASKVFINSERATRAKREISVAKKLAASGAPVLPIVDDCLSSPDGKLWFVTPIAADGSLRNFLQTGAPYGGSLETALTFFRRLLNATLQLHAQDVAHRDLKPDNILLDGDRLFLADLGLCLPLGDAEGERLTGVLERIGSLHYLPKEAFGRQPLDRNQFAFDAYALGKIMYQVLSGRQLPGFVSHTEPEYDLTRNDKRAIARAINRIMRGLLHDEPSVRLETLAQLDEQIADLLQSPQPGGEAKTIDAFLLLAADGLAIHANKSNNASQPGAEIETDLNSIRDEVLSVWNSAESLRRIEELVIMPNSGVIELHRDAAAPQLRSMVLGPSVPTRRALEPLEDRGYPVLPKTEVGCAIRVQPKEKPSPFATLCLGVLVAPKGKEICVALAVALRENDERGNADIVTGTENVFSMGAHDGRLINAARKAADEVVERFVRVIADTFAAS